MSDTEQAEDPKKPTRTVRRRQKTRELLMQAAIDLLMENELDDFKLEDITEIADVGRRTFYNHFDNKNECVLAALKLRFGHYAENAASNMERILDPVTSLAKSASEVFDNIVADPITPKLVAHPNLLSEAIDKSQQEYLFKDLASGFIQRRFKITNPVSLLRPVLHWGFVGLIMDTVKSNKPVNKGSDWAKVMLHNLAVPKQDIDAVIEKISDGQNDGQC